MKAVHFRYPTSNDMKWSSSESTLGVTELSSKASRTTGGETRLFRDGAKSKLSALIDQILFGFVDTVLSGTGRGKPLWPSPSGKRGESTDRGIQGGTGMTDEHDVLSIDSAQGWVFAFEGGAHILFKHTLDNPLFVLNPLSFFSISDDILADVYVLKTGKLLRLAKRNKHTLPILKKHQAVQDTFLPLLTTENGQPLVVHTDLVKISRNVLETLQSTQVSANTKRLSELDLEETHGTLLEDLSADPSILLLEFKPKWLSQSPTAPRNANTCRTCALRRLRRKAPKAHPRFCPLDLSSGQYSRVHRAVVALLQEKNIHHEVVAAQITEYMMTSELIPILLKAQISTDCSLATKMTLRDCTLFVQIPRELFSYSEPCGAVVETPNAKRVSNHVVNNTIPSRPIKVVIADLDEKSEEARGEYWKSLEESLIVGGYYLGEGKLDPNARDCDLSDDLAWKSLVAKDF